MTDTLALAQNALARCRRLGWRMTLVGFTAVVIGIVLFAAWPPTDYSRRTLHLLAVLVLPTIGPCILWPGVVLWRTAARGRSVLNGPNRTLFLATEYVRGPRGSRRIDATLRRAVDQQKPDSDFKFGLYRTPAFSVGTRGPATVFSTLEPNSVVIVVIGSEALVGRVRYSAFEVERLRTLADTADTEGQQKSYLEAARTHALTGRRRSLETRILLWAAESCAVLIPGAALGHRHQPAIGWTISLLVLVAIVALRRRLKARTRRTVPF